MLIPTNFLLSPFLRSPVGVAHYIDTPARLLELASVRGIIAGQGGLWGRHNTTDTCRREIYFLQEKEIPPADSLGISLHRTNRNFERHGSFVHIIQGRLVAHSGVLERQEMLSKLLLCNST